ncbi:MAG: Holliday junction branch migration protein RuvA [Oscillospiraceae bacterium]|jgi:Holliday junction DNA helicase RuvA|nr:Holliday junction branch migration protein RuvA [Oscillospiraceae bacterium]
MFYYLEGKVTHMESNLAVVDCGGVGYAVHTSARTLGTLKSGDRAKLFTHAVIREDAFDLFGFASERELSTFRLLIGVSGVGARSAVAILSLGAPEDLAIAIAGGDERMLTSAQGIGRKIAQRIILELKDKIAKDMSGLPITVSAVGGVSSVTTGVLGDVTAALTVLGYTPQEVTASLKSLSPDELAASDTGELVRAILKRSVKQ